MLIAIHRPAVLLVLAALLGACGGATSASSASSEPPASAAPQSEAAEPSDAASEAAEATPEPTEAELSLPDEVTFESIGTSTVTAVASFDGSADGASISIRDVESDYDDPFGYGALILEGACSERADADLTAEDFEGAVAKVTFDKGEDAELLVSADQLGEILASPHSILITHEAGEPTWACADIGA